MKKKLNLNQLQVQSFVTNLDENEKNIHKGGAVSVNIQCKLSLPTCSCMNSDACPSAVNSPLCQVTA